jgi:class 3 adenylate cyclase/tetratricopeptide (TPR) repeat protein
VLSLIGTKLGSYEILEEVGRGGMAAVYRARQTSVDRDVAIKVIQGNFSADDQAVMRFQREARLIARLEHPHILPVHDFDGAHQPPYIVMRYLEGGTLKNVLQRGRLPIEEALYLLSQVVGALDYAHRQGIVHRDIKPSNIMIDKDGNAFVTDFGIARIIENSEGQITGTGTMLGTPDYMSPEQIRGESDLDLRADIYSLAVMAFQMLAGRLPFQSATPMGVVVMHLNLPVPDITTLVPELPEGTNAVLKKAMAKDRELRYDSVVTFLAELTQALGKSIAVRPERLREATLETIQRRQESDPAIEPGSSSTSTPGELNKTVTVLFASAAEYAEIVAGLKGPEAARRAMKALWDAGTLAIAERGGKVLDRSEHDLLAVWGVDASREDDAEQAIYAALLLQSTMRDQGWAVLEEEEDDPLPMKIGIHSGLALLVRDSISGTWSASGGPVILAQRLSENSHGKILISRDTYRWVQGVFDIYPDEPLRVRSRKEALPVYWVTAAKARSLRLQVRSVEGVVTRMIGRDGELKQLQNAFLDAVEEQETQLVTVLGAAGIGKSRLQYEFDQWSELREEKFWVLRGRAIAAMNNQPYALLRDILSFRFEILDNDTPAVVRQKLEKGVASLTGVNGETAHLMAYLCGFDMSESPYVAGQLGDPAQLNERARQATLLFLDRVATNGPAIAELEDLHYADIASLDLLTEFLSQRSDRPFLVIALARPALLDRYPNWGGGVEFHRRINLQSLGRRECRDLVAEILQKVPDVPRDLRDLLVERGEGNPLYLEELIKMLLEDHVIIKESEDVWRVETSRVANLRVPPTLVGVLQARFDSLLYPEKVILQRASALGRAFFDSALYSMEGSDEVHLESLDRILAGLERRGFIHRRETSSFAGSMEYVFAQNMLRDLIYDTLLEWQRKAYHACIAEWLSAVAGGRVAEYTPQIAENYEHAGQLDKAGEYFRQAGRQAFERGVFTDSARLLERSLALVGETDDPGVFETRLLLSDALIRSGELQSVTALLNFTLESARHSENASVQSRALYQLSQVQNYNGNWDAAMDLLSQALQLARDSGDENALGWVLYGMADTSLRMGKAEEVRMYAEEALDMARKTSNRFLERMSLNRLGTAYVELGLFAEAIMTYQELLALAHSALDQHTTLVALINLGQVFWYARDVQASTNYTLQALALAETQDIPYLVTAVNLARNYALSGLVEKARPMILKALQRACKVGAMAWTVGVVGWAGIVLAAEGDVERGLALVGLACDSPHFASDSRRELLSDVKLLPHRQLSQQQIEEMMKAGEKLDIDQEIEKLLNTLANS